MRIAYTDEQALRRELRAYFTDLMTPERRAALVGGTEASEYGDAYRDVVSRMGKDGWLALGWPTEYGDQNRSMMDQLIFTDEAAIAGAPGAVPDHQLGGADDHALRHRRARPTSCPASRPVTCISPSATRSQAQAPTWPICAPPPSPTVTST